MMNDERREDEEVILSRTTRYGRVFNGSISRTRSLFILVILSLATLAISRQTSQACCTGVYALDTFSTVAYDNDDGPVKFVWAWREIGDDGNPSGGTIRITNGLLRLSGKNKTICRDVNDVPYATDRRLRFYIDSAVYMYGTVDITFNDQSIARLGGHQAGWREYPLDGSGELCFTVRTCFSLCTTGHYDLDNVRIDYTITLPTDTPTLTQTPGLSPTLAFSPTTTPSPTLTIEPTVQPESCHTLRDPSFESGAPWLLDNHNKSMIANGALSLTVKSGHEWSGYEWGGFAYQYVTPTMLLTHTEYAVFFEVAEGEGDILFNSTTDGEYFTLGLAYVYHVDGPGVYTATYNTYDLDLSPENPFFEVESAGFKGKIARVCLGDKVAGPIPTPTRNPTLNSSPTPTDAALQATKTSTPLPTTDTLISTVEPTDEPTSERVGSGRFIYLPIIVKSISPFEEKQ